MIKETHIGKANKEVCDSWYAWECSCGKVFDSCEEWILHRENELGVKR